MFSKSTEYALRATLYIAQKGTEEKKIGIEEVSKAIGSPRSFTAKILQSLTKDNKIIRSATGPHGGDQRALHKVLGGVILAQHAGRIVMADQSGRGQIGVALDEHQWDAPLRRDRFEHRGFAGARRPLEQQVTARGDGREHDLELALPAHEPARDALPCCGEV